ncbi:receptor-like protein kinase HERK 1 [Rutidosis leptorrhynchoides]|uniref:receptor-like protein kinase HERK 1 n=1 Tax=Rutidosis leptorrhynchoides TaxID=125765 RepID=UPI003A994838
MYYIGTTQNINVGICNEAKINGMDLVRIPFDVIKSATDNFIGYNQIGSGAVYKGRLTHGNNRGKYVDVKRFDKGSAQGARVFYRELDILLKFKHKNVINLEGYCDENDEKAIVYEHSFHGSLDKHLNDARLKWVERLKMCIDIASGLEFLHGGLLRRESVIHRNIRSSNVLLSVSRKAKITGFGHSLISPINQEMDYIIDDHIVRKSHYSDPTYMQTGILTRQSDIYSFGVILFEMLCGRAAHTYRDSQPFASVVKHHVEEGKIDDIVFKEFDKQIEVESFDIFFSIAYQCIDDDREKRPTASQVLQQLMKAWECQADFEIWERKLPTDFTEIVVQMSRSNKINSKMMKKDLYHMFCEGILLQGDKVISSSVDVG